ncbi:M42 family metallopeptidase [Mesomycoplasma moatsii]|uniref:M42 family metallopeptidase n=1 Tax=Mesomycoplasma moatsii TaxID=171287 RepID=UPI0003B37DF0
MKKEINNMYETVKKYCSIDGLSRYEEKVVDELKKLTNDKKIQYERDGIGSIILFQSDKPKSGPVIQIAAHMDEVGFIVQDITDKGQLRLSMIGGIWPLTVIGTKAIVYNAEGKKYEGVFGHTSIHILELEKRNKVPELKDLYIDLGFKSKKEAEDNLIEIGSRVCLTGDCFLMNNEYAVAKAMDNRAGIAVLEEIINRIKNKKLKSQVYFVGTVQEEVGTRGAKTSVQKIKPNIAIALDTCASHDTYQAIPGIQELGKGVALRIKDMGTLMDPKLIDYLMKLGKEYNIPVYKYVAQGGGTDAAELQYGNGGTATITISLPQRYLHSPLGVCSMKDLIAAADLIEKFLLKIDQKEFDKYIKYN